MERKLKEKKWGKNKREAKKNGKEKNKQTCYPLSFQQ